MDRDADFSQAVEAEAYPTGVAPLRGLQFFAIAWVVLNQFRDHLGLEAGARSGLVAKGYLGAALFFVVSGFLVCRRYEALRRIGQFRYGAFLWRRVTFTYPLHLAVLAAMAALLTLGVILGERVHHASFDPRDLPANLLLVQAWGAVPTDRWNFPSWLISAEWFAYLVFPLTAWTALKGLRWTPLAVAAPLALFAGLFVLASKMGVLFTDMTAQIGALQTIPAFLLGAALWRVSTESTMPRLGGAVLALAALAWIVGSASVRLSDLVIWPAFAPLVFGLDQMAKRGSRFQNGRPLNYLGHLSTAMLLIYLPVDIAYFRASQLLLGQPRGLEAWVLWGGVFPTILLAATIAHHFVQRPIWRWLLRHDPFSTGDAAISE